MNLNDIYESSGESETVRKSSPPGDLGEYITTAQAAKILDVEMSRIRQMISDGELNSYQPEEGRRDHMLKLSEVHAKKYKDKDVGGRPPKDK